MATCLVELRASSSPEGRRLRSTTQQPTVPPGGLALAPWRPCGCPSHRGFRRGSSRRETLSPHTVLASSLASPSHQVTTLFPRGTSGNDIVPQERTMFPRKRLCSSGNDFISAAQLLCVENKVVSSGDDRTRTYIADRRKGRTKVVSCGAYPWPVSRDKPKQSRFLRGTSNTYSSG